MREEGLRLRFQREIAILQKLDHPNIVRFFGTGEEDGVDYYAMEYVDGPSYQQIIENQGRLLWPEVVELGKQVALALKHAHDRGVVHRDIKPSNLLRSAPLEDGGPCKVKLSDFGISTLFASRHLTAPGGILGTAEYISPEQAAGKPATRRSDLYSLGVVLYTLLAGKTPFVGDMLDLLHKHRYGQFERLTRLLPDLPPGLDAIICQLLEKDPAKRPVDGSMLAKQLERVLRNDDSKTILQIEGLRGDPGPGPATLASHLVRRGTRRCEARRAPAAPL